MRNRNFLLLAGLLLAATTGACGDRDAEPEAEPIATIPDAFPEILLPPEGRLVATAGASDALQLIFTSPLPSEPIVGYYRTRLGQAPWVIVGDTREGDVTTLYAEYTGRPMWVRVLPIGDGGSRIELNGAVLASAGAEAPARQPATAAPPGEGAVRGAVRSPGTVIDSL